VCDFLLANSTDLCTISRRFRVIVTHWSNSRCWYRVLLFNSPIRVERLNCGLQNLALKARAITLSRAVYNILRYAEPVSRGSPVCLRQTDRITTVIAQASGLPYTLLVTITLDNVHRVSKNCAHLFLSELGQIYTDYDNIWQKDGKEAKII